MGSRRQLVDSTESALVYSTATGRICSSCGMVQLQCRCRKKTAVEQQTDMVYVGRQTKGRKGSGVTVITGLAGSSSEVKQLAKLLKKRCGSGGTVKDGMIEIQGEHRKALCEMLAAMGYKVKQVGG